MCVLKLEICVEKEGGEIEGDDEKEGGEIEREEDERDE